MKNKREVSSLLPYRKKGNTYEYYTQKRDKDVDYAPNQVGIFGGGLEADESPEEAMRREIQEELGYATKNAQYFCRYEIDKFIHHVFIEEVGEEFEAQVKVQEGQYGRFYSPEEVNSIPDVIPHSRVVIGQVDVFLHDGI